MPKRKPKRPRWRQPTNEGVTTMKWSKKIFHTNATGVTTQDPQEARNGPLKIKKALQLPKETKAGKAQQTCARATPRMETKIGRPKMRHGAAYIRKKQHHRMQNGQNVTSAKVSSNALNQVQSGTTKNMCLEVT